MVRNKILKTAAIISFGAMFALAGCAHEPNVPNWGHGSRGDGPLAHHPQGVDHIETPRVIEQQGNVIAPPPPQDYNAVSYLTGCTGSFSVTNRNTGELLVTGRGLSTPQGMMVLGRNGEQTGKIVNAMGGQSLTFKPDCNCKPQQAGMAPPPPTMCAPHN